MTWHDTTLDHHLDLCRLCTSFLFSAPISEKGHGLLHKLIPQVCPLPLKRLDYNHMGCPCPKSALPPDLLQGMVFFQCYHLAATHSCLQSLVSPFNNCREVAGVLFDLTNGTSELCYCGISDNIGKKFVSKVTRDFHTGLTKYSTCPLSGGIVYFSRCRRSV